MRGRGASASKVTRPTPTISCKLTQQYRFYPLPAGAPKAAASPAHRSARSLHTPMEVSRSRSTQRRMGGNRRHLLLFLCFKLLGAVIEKFLVHFHKQLQCIVYQSMDSPRREGDTSMTIREGRKSLMMSQSKIIPKQPKSK